MEFCPKMTRTEKRKTLPDQYLKLKSKQYRVLAFLPFFTNLLVTLDWVDFLTGFSSN